MGECVIEVTIEKEVKEAAEKIFREKYDLPLEEACILFIKECIRCKGIPFEIKL